MKTEQQKENMRKHIAFLRDNADKIRDHFDMSMLYDPLFVGCGTPACSLGWSAVSLNVTDTWREETSSLLFGVLFGSRKWHYLFNGGWLNINNTPEAAAARMEAVLYNQAPKGWKYTTEFAHPVVNTLEPVFSHYQKAKVR